MKEWWEDDAELDRMLGTLDPSAAVPVQSSPEEILTQTKVAVHAGAISSSSTLFLSVATALLVGFGGGWFVHEQTQPSSSEEKSSVVENSARSSQKQEEMERVQTLLGSDVHVDIDDGSPPKEEDTHIALDIADLDTGDSSSERSEAKQPHYAKTVQKESSTYRQPTPSTSSSRRELDDIDSSKEGKEDILHQSLADNPKKKSSQYTVKREQVTNPKTHSTSTDTEKDKTQKLDEEERQIQLFTGIGVRGNKDVRHMVPHLYLGVSQTKQNKYVQNLSLQFDLNKINLQNNRDSIVPGMTVSASLGLPTKWGVPSLGINAGVRPLHVRINGNDFNDGQEQEREEIRFIPVIGTLFSHEIDDHWFAQVQLETNLLPHPAESPQGLDEEGKGRTWWGVQVGKRF